MDRYTFIHIGAPAQERFRATHDIVVYLNSKTDRCWRNSGSTRKAVNSRILTHLNCLSALMYYVYAPVNPLNCLKANIEACDEFDKSLQSLIGKTDRVDIILIIGEFDAGVKLEQTSSVQSEVGTHEFDK